MGASHIPFGLSWSKGFSSERKERGFDRLSPNGVGLVLSFRACREEDQNGFTITAMTITAAATPGTSLSRRNWRSVMVRWPLASFLA